MTLISKKALLMDMELEPDGWYKGRIIEHHVNSSPIVDAVPVVRCRECEYACPLVQEEWVACILWSRASEADGFCHKGAKKGGGEE